MILAQVAMLLASFILVLPSRNGRIWGEYSVLSVSPFFLPSQSQFFCSFTVKTVPSEPQSQCHLRWLLIQRKPGFRIRQLWIWIPDHTQLLRCCLLLSFFLGKDWMKRKWSITQALYIEPWEEATALFPLPLLALLFHTLHLLLITRLWVCPVPAQSFTSHICTKACPAICQIPDPCPENEVLVLEVVTYIICWMEIYSASRMSCCLLVSFGYVS